MESDAENCAEEQWGALDEKEKVQVLQDYQFLASLLTVYVLSLP
jgi:hypothetical protein